MMRFLRTCGILLMLIGAPAVTHARSPLTDSLDVQVSVGSNEVENSIAFDLLNPDVLMVSNISYGDTSMSIKAWASEDAGHSWASLGIAAASGFDPISAIGARGEAAGRLYVSRIGPGGLVLNYKDVVDSTTTWTDTVVEAPPDANSNWDKEFVWVDPDSGNIYLGFSDDESVLSGRRVYLKYSTDIGDSWQPNGNPMPIDEGADENRNYEGVVLATDASGRLYATWASRQISEYRTREIMFRYSESSEQVSWHSPTYGQTIKSLQGFGYHSLNGKSMRALVAPSMVVAGDSLWIVYADKQPGQTDTDIFVLESIDQGLTWNALGGTAQSPAYKQVNSETTPETNRDQWFPWVARDDCTGALAVVFYDSRDNTDSVNTYLAVSYDGGESWDDFKVSDTDWSGDPSTEGGKEAWAGDYIGLVSRDGVAFPVWSDDRVGQYSFRAFVSPISLWGVEQSTVGASYDNGFDDVIDVTVTWSTNIAAEDGDQVVLTSPVSGTHTTYTSTLCDTCSSGGGKNHSVTFTDLPCEIGYWTYTVRSSRASCSTSRYSNAKTVKVEYCLE